MKIKEPGYFIFILILIGGQVCAQVLQPGSSASLLNDTSKWVVTDPYYPKFHVAAPYGWMNDPHPVYFKGAYHLFYQYSYVRNNPYGRVGLKPGERPQRSWGHAISTDLVRWKHMPVALTASLHGAPNDPHIFSGVVVDHNGVGTALYTINNKDIWLATSKDKDLATFTKYPKNPVVKGPPAELPTTGLMRDPWVWKEGNTWYMIVGSGLAERKGPVIPLYRSTNLVDWEYMHPFYRADSSRFDFLGDAGFCECPAFFALGDKFVLVFSDKTTYLVGRYENHRFVPEKRGRLDYGESPGVTDGGIYVPQFALDDKGRRIMWGWADRWQTVESQIPEYVKAGWSGMQTLPRVLTLNKDGLIDFAPAEELSALRSDHKEFSMIPLSADSSRVLEGVQGKHFEIKTEIKPGNAITFGIELLNVAEPARIFYNVVTKSICYNQVSVPLTLGRNENLDLRLFIDGKMIEIYANKKIVLTEKLKPVNTDGYGIRLFAKDGRATAVKVDTWTMGSIW